LAFPFGLVSKEGREGGRGLGILAQGAGSLCAQV